MSLQVTSSPGCWLRSWSGVVAKTPYCTASNKYLDEGGRRPEGGSTEDHRARGSAQARPVYLAGSAWKRSPTATPTSSSSKIAVIRSFPPVASTKRTNVAR